MMKGRHEKIWVPVGAAGSCALGQADGAAGKTKSSIHNGRPALPMEGYWQTGGRKLDEMVAGTNVRRIQASFCMRSECRSIYTSAKEVPRM